MSLFDNNKHVGLAIIIAGILQIVLPIWGIVDADDHQVAIAVAAIGGIIFGFILVGYGLKVRSGSNDRVAILSGFIRVLGIGSIISGLFVIIADIIGEPNVTIAEGVVSLIVGLILLWIGQKVAGKSKNTISQILWILLVIVFLILAILALIGLIASLLDGNWAAALANVADLFIYGYAFVASLSKDIKSSMGI
jgi:hypothetical protein